MRFLLASADLATGEGSGRRLQDQRDALAAADAGAREAVANAAATHLLQEGQRQARPGRRQGMPQRDRSAVDVELLYVEPELANHAQDLARERLVDLPEADVLERQARSFQRFACGRCRAEAHQLGLDAD